MRVCLHVSESFIFESYEGFGIHIKTPEPKFLFPRVGVQNLGGNFKKDNKVLAKVTQVL